MIPNRLGHLIVVVGAMGSGKTEYLLDRVAAVEWNERLPRLWVPARDTRSRVGGQPCLYSRTGRYRHAVTWDLKQPSASECHHIFDEIHLFPPSVVKWIANARQQQMTSVVVAGLERSSEGKPFPTTMALLEVADQVVRMASRCRCGGLTSETLCKVPKTSQILIGGDDLYEPVCRKCWLDANHLRETKRQ